MKNWQCSCGRWVGTAGGYCLTCRKEVKPDEIDVLRVCLLSLSAELSPWTWQNKECYPRIRAWEDVAKILNFPIQECIDSMKKISVGQTFVRKWLNENPKVHQPISAEQIRKESG